MFKLVKQNEYSKKSYLKSFDRFKKNLRTHVKKRSLKKEFNGEDFFLVKKAYFFDRQEEQYNKRWDFKPCIILQTDPFTISCE